MRGCARNTKDDPGPLACTPCSPYIVGENGRSPAACPGHCAAPPASRQAELVALAAVLGLIDRNLSERATRERVLADAVA